MEALRGFYVIARALPERGAVAGIDPRTIPPQLRFILRPAEKGDDRVGIDCVQAIGPMMTTIRLMDRRIRDPEARLAAVARRQGSRR